MGRPLSIPAVALGAAAHQSMLIITSHMLLLLAGEQMSPSNHALIMQRLYQVLEVAPLKVTHEMRVFAAQIMFEMGVSLEVG